MKAKDRNDVDHSNEYSYGKSAEKKLNYIVIVYNFNLNIFCMDFKKVIAIMVLLNKNIFNKLNYQSFIFVNGLN